MAVNVLRAHRILHVSRIRVNISSLLTSQTQTTLVPVNYASCKQLSGKDEPDCYIL